MQDKKQFILKSAGIGFSLGGLIVLIFTFTFIHMLAMLDISFLTSRYGPSAPKETRIYENLYEFTTFVVNHRNYYAQLFYMTIGLASIIVGIIFLTWARNVKQLKKQIGSNNQAAL